jgi:hypothetical protein
MASFEQDILILCKTYPSPSGKHVETSCVAGIDTKGNLIRLPPRHTPKFAGWQRRDANPDVWDQRPICNDVRDLQMIADNRGCGKSASWLPGLDSNQRPFD